MKPLVLFLILALAARVAWLFIQIRYHVKFEMR